MVAVHGVGPQATSAQTERRGAALRIVPGVAYAGGRFESDATGSDDSQSESTAAFSVGAQLWGGMSNTVGFLFELTWQPTDVQSPLRDERYSPLYLLAGPEFAIAEMYLRPEAGIVWLYWSGSEVVDSTTRAFAFGLALGTERPVYQGFHLAPEATARVSVESGLTTYMVGFQLGIGWRSIPP